MIMKDSELREYLDGILGVVKDLKIAALDSPIGANNKTEWNPDPPQKPWEPVTKTEAQIFSLTSRIAEIEYDLHMLREDFNKKKGE
jgi:hypothetical protein